MEADFDPRVIRLRANFGSSVASASTSGGDDVTVNFGPFSAGASFGGGSSSSAAWDARLDDPAADYDDGREHPEERAIKDPDAKHAEKWSAWSERAERLNSTGHLGEAREAYKHMEYHIAHMIDDE